MMEDPKVINFAKLSWKELKPEDDYDVKLELMPEAIQKHEDFVQCYLQNDFDSFRVLKIMTKWEQSFDDLSEEGQLWHKKLAECLRRLSRQYDRNQARRR